MKNILIEDFWAVHRHFVGMYDCPSVWVQIFSVNQSNHMTAWLTASDLIDELRCQIAVMATVGGNQMVPQTNLLTANNPLWHAHYKRCRLPAAGWADFGLRAT